MSKLINNKTVINMFPVTPDLSEYGEIILTETTANYVSEQLKSGHSVAGRVAMGDQATAYNMVFVPMRYARLTTLGGMNPWGGGNGDVYFSVERPIGSFAFAMNPDTEIYPSYVAEKLGMNPKDPNTIEIANFLNVLNKFWNLK